LEERIEELEFLADRFEEVDKEEFLDRRDLQRVAERSLEILKEAAKGLPSRVRERSPSVPWSEMARTRDMMIHAYHRVEPEIVWRTIHDDALPLRPQLECVFEEEMKMWEGG
jgi:uncharacterized protein with HEPN domain